MYIVEDVTTPVNECKHMLLNSFVLQLVVIYFILTNAVVFISLIYA